MRTFILEQAKKIEKQKFRNKRARFFNRKNRNLLQAAFGATVLVPLSFTESNFVLMTGSLLPLVISFWLYFKFGLKFKVKI